MNTTKNQNTIETLQELADALSPILAKVSTLPEIDRRFVTDAGDSVYILADTHVKMPLWDILDTLAEMQAAIPSDHLELIFCG
jgi:hypothetical protein